MRDIEPIISHQKIFISQKFEPIELIGFETRNKYAIKSEAGIDLAYAAEEKRGLFVMLLKQYIGHWRKFNILFFNSSRQMILRAHHPFRWFFQCLEVYDNQNIKLGSVQQRFGIFKKSFDILDENDKVIMTIRSGFFSFWTFQFLRHGTEVAVVSKKWSGGLSEIFTDRDNFLVEYKSVVLPPKERTLVLVAAMFVDLVYFERNQ